MIVFKDEVVGGPAVAAVSDTMANVAGIRNLARASDFKNSAVSAEDLANTEGIYFDRVGVAVVSAERAAIQSLQTASVASGSPIMVIEPEYFSCASNGLTGVPLEYLRGYRDAVNHLYDGLTGPAVEAGVAGMPVGGFNDTSQLTWGLQATKVHTSRFSGQGVRVAVLDTGIDLDHPDFQGREIVTQSFINGQTVQDGHGHGTHCIGTACGPKLPASGVPRYGVAFGATIYAGKVLGSSTGGNGPIVAGIEWALANGCQVISLSISVTDDVQIDQYNVPIRRALEAGSLVVAAAGNNANRAGGHFGFVGSPANAPDAMAVAALDNRLAMYNKSARSSTRTGEAGKINIGGPGVGVFSSYPVSRGTHRFWEGTSMATPHVAGIAALWIEARRKTGADLWRLLLEESLPFQGAQVLDVGSGLVQAPQ